MKRQLSEAEIKRRQRKRKIRKRRFLAFLLILLLIGAGTFYYFLKTKLFPIKKIAVSGSKIYTAEDIIKAGGITGKTPLMSFTENSLKTKLQKKLPYVETVKISRTFPDAVKITVSDAKEVFCFKENGKYYTASENLRVLTVKNELPENLIEVTAKDVTVKTGKNIEFAKQEENELFDLLYSYTKEKSIPVTAIDISNIIHITIFVADRFEVNLGSNENITAKINHLSGMIKEIGERKGKINLEMWSKSDSKGTFIEEK
ncbi:MAG: FtsQ-type POTRA domain-containing protein [Clostridia bacterium]|nr:FtsQ-type POTRA domain-containing protein [Clostridia bacterium]